MKNRKISQGDIWIYTSNDTVGSEQEATDGRCCVVVQGNVGNKYSNTTIICPLTKRTKTYIPQHYQLYKKDYPFLSYDSLVLPEQIRVVDIRERMERKIGEINNKDLQEIIKKITENF